MHLSGSELQTTPYSAQSGIKYFRHGRHWMLVDVNDSRSMRQVGPVYETRRDLLADHPDYLVRAGWLGEKALAAVGKV